ncbi:MAG TPA: porin family protein [Chitinophagaceae bacterium]|nr:porin family protein [Chitinophagaceae bacterium]
MKKLFLFALLLISTFSYGQKFQFGAKAGVNISNFSGGDFNDVEKKSLIGFHGGIYLRFAIANFSIQPEAMISTQGAKIDSVSGSYDWKITYVNVPIMAQYRFPGGFYLEAGPQVGFKIDENIENETLQDFAKGLDLSIAAGLGYRGKKGLGIGGRYSAGLSKIGDFEPANGIDPDFKNGVIQVSVYIPLTR